MHKAHPLKMKLEHFPSLRRLKISVVEENPTAGC
jgi:hypothetical protein